MQFEIILESLQNFLIPSFMIRTIRSRTAVREDLRIFDLACYYKISNSRYCFALKWISMYLWCQILSTNKISLTLQRAAFGVQINISTFA